jgi:hypothetical protein
MNPRNRQAHLRELRMTRALEGLPRNAAAELARADNGEGSEPDDYELAAAALHLAMFTPDEQPCSPDLRSRLEQSAIDHLEG